jgi:hypothetical protein
MNFDPDLALQYLCENTNFRYCRLTGVIENHGCPALQIGSNSIVYDIPFFILSLVVTVFLAGFFPFLRPHPIKWKRQRETRAVLLWRVHCIACGVGVFFNGLSVSMTAKDGKGQQVLMVFRGIALTAGQILLIVIALIDCHIIPQFIAQSWQFTVGVFLVAGIIALCWLSQFANPTGIGLVGFGLFIPLFSIVFFWMSMIPVCIIRFRDPMKLGKGIGAIISAIAYVTLVAGLNVASIFAELFLNGAICIGTVGILSGSSLSVLFFAFYRVFVQVWFTVLKKHEIDDGLPTRPKKAEDESSSEQYRALPVEFSDYSYGYTYSSEENDV